MIEVVACAGGVVKVEPLGQLTGIIGQKYFGHHGLPGVTQISGHAWRAYEVVVVNVEQ